MKEKELQAELQQKYLELQLINQQITQMHQQVQMLDSQLAEFSNTKAALDDLAKAKVGSEVLVPISPGIFVKGELKDNKELVINVGADVLVKKDIDGAKEIIDEQIKEVKRVHDLLMSTIQELISQAQHIEMDFEEISKNV